MPATFQPPDGLANAYKSLVVLLPDMPIPLAALQKLWRMVGWVLLVTESTSVGGFSAASISHYVRLRGASATLAAFVCRSWLRAPAHHHASTR